jgi:NAD(P)-dependent dehydrogenase (short-subunit alcohol dehydrogenase family)
MTTTINTQPVIIVTGASRGVGSDIARWLAKSGAAVTLVARTDSGLHRVADDVVSLGGDSLVIPADISSADTCREITAATIERFGRFDAIINNAGILEPLEKISDANPDAWRYNIDVNLAGPVYMCMAAVSELRLRKGRIVNVSSGAAEHVIQAAGAYCTAKAALNHFTRVLAAEEPNVTAIAVRPGVVDTDMQVMLRKQGPRKMPKEQAAYYLDLKTEGRLEPPHVPARAIAWLATYAPDEWSGAYMNYDDPQISMPALEVFGPSL